MYRKLLLIAALTSVLFSGCASNSVVAENINKEIILVASKDVGIESALRPIPTLISSVVQPARFDHVYIDSTSASATSLETISLRDAIANALLISTGKKIQKLNLDSAKLNWFNGSSGLNSPSEIEAVGGYGIETGNLSEVNFDTNEVVVINPSRLDALVSKAKVVSGQFFVVAYADESGIEAKNYLLSQDRATSVANYLANKGINTSRIASSGAGVSNLYPGLNANRRASVSFVIEGTEK